MLANLDADIRADLFAGQWSLMSGMRNRIAHGYLLVDPAIVRQTIDHDVVVIVTSIQQALA